MKKKIAAILAVLLLLTACSTQKKPEPQPEPEQEVVTEPAKEPEVEEVPVEVTTVQGNPVTPERQTAEGLIEDAIGYILEYPVFSEFDGAETVNGFYTELVKSLEAYAKETVYSTASEKGCVANVYSSMENASENDGILQVTYKFWVEYSDNTTDEKVRTDRFDMATGERIQED